MALTTEKAKQLTATFLKYNVRKTLSRNFDWKVARSISTGEPLSEEDIQYRASTVATYNQRMAALEAATNIDEVANISIKV